MNQKNIPHHLVNQYLQLLSDVDRPFEPQEKLNKEVYAGVLLVSDCVWTENKLKRTRVMLIGGDIPLHTHAKMGERFTVRHVTHDFKGSAICGDQEFDLALEGTITAVQGVPHGFRVAAGFAIIEVEIVNFDPEDIQVVAEAAV